MRSASRAIRRGSRWSWSRTPCGAMCGRSLSWLLRRLLSSCRIAERPPHRPLPRTEYTSLSARWHGFCVATGGRSRSSTRSWTMRRRVARRRVRASHPRENGVDRQRTLSQWPWSWASLTTIRQPKTARSMFPHLLKIDTHRTNLPSFAHGAPTSPSKLPCHETFTKISTSAAWFPSLAARTSLGLRPREHPEYPCFVNGSI
mmetsp:Transcript_31377/g.76885  ORF Transcript_31377/g.76885 Transcript_31377/m.76885 type:complete len:202 (-) Transcript_31377:672-1277(-)